MATSDIKLFVYGGVAACFAEAATFPIDTAKTRLQLQGQAKDVRHSTTPYRGMIHCWTRVTAEEGFRVLYSGIGPALLRQTVYGSLKYGIYYRIQAEYADGESSSSTAVNVLSAMVAGSVSSAVSNPTDVLKVRMQSKTRERNGLGMWRAFGDIHEKEGVKGLWRGAVPTAQRAGIVAAVQLPVYDFSKGFLVHHRVLKDDGVVNHLISSFSAGLCACLASSPIDVVRTRMMDQRRLRKMLPPSSHVYITTVECFLATVRNEGFAALYRGFVPAFTRMGPWNVIFFLVYEQLKKL